MLEQLADNSWPQQDTSHAAEEPRDIFHAAGISDTVESSQIRESGHVLPVGNIGPGEE